MEIRLEKLSIENARDIFVFESENRDYFERSLPPRNKAYYFIEEFDKIMDTLLNEQANGECFMYVIRNNENKVVGRINMFISKDNEKIIGDLGYRIGENYSGLGIAKEAVRLILEENIVVDKIVAGTAKENIASKKVLERNGFIFEKETKDYIEINGRMVDSLNYVKSLR